MYKNSAVMVPYCCQRVGASDIWSGNSILSELAIGLQKLLVNKSVLVEPDLVIFFPWVRVVLVV